jgi:hypothetical protein
MFEGIGKYFYTFFKNPFQNCPIEEKRRPL